MARAVVRRRAVGAVDERNVVIDLVFGNAVFELRVVAVDELVGAGDFETGSTTLAGAAEGLAVLTARRDVVGPVARALVDGPDPDVVGAAVGDDGVAGCGEGGVEGRQGEEEFGEHFCCKDYFE